MGLQSTYYSSNSISINNSNHQVPYRRKKSSIRINYCNHPRRPHSKTRLLWILVVVVIIIVVFLFSLLSFSLYTPSSSSGSSTTTATTRYMKFLTSFLSNRHRPTGSSHTGSSLGVLHNNMNTVGIQSDGTTTTTTTTPVSSLLPLQKVLTTALWSYFAGDALSAPTHWYYGGYTQIQQYYGNHGIMTYTKPSMILHGSILNKSNLNGGGRSTTNTIKTNDSSMKTIIGHVINHGKQDL